MTIILWTCLAMLIVASGLSLWRLERGPSTMDRAVALDVVTAAVIGLTIITMAITGRRDLVPVVVVLSLVGFITSTTIARFNSSEREVEGGLVTADEGRPLTADEVQQVLSYDLARRDDDVPARDDGMEQEAAGSLPPQPPPAEGDRR